MKYPQTPLFCSLILATRVSGVGPADKNIAPLMGPESMDITVKSGSVDGERIDRFIAQFMVELMQTDRVLPQGRPPCSSRTP